MSSSEQVLRCAHMGRQRNTTTSAAVSAKSWGESKNYTCNSNCSTSTKFLQPSKAKMLTLVILKLKIVLERLSVLGLSQRSSSLNLQASKLSFLDKTPTRTNYNMPVERESQQTSGNSKAAGRPKSRNTQPQILLCQVWLEYLPEDTLKT